MRYQRSGQHGSQNAAQDFRISFPSACPAFAEPAGYGSGSGYPGPRRNGLLQIISLCHAGPFYERAYRFFW